MAINLIAFLSAPACRNSRYSVNSLSSNDREFVSEFIRRSKGNKEFDPHAVSDDGDEWPFLVHAAYAGRPKVVELLLNKGANVDSKTKHELRTALMQASGAGREMKGHLLTVL